MQEPGESFVAPGTGLASDAILSDGQSIGKTSEGFSRAGTLSLSLISTIPWLSFSVLPYEISVLSESYGIAPGAASWIATTEMLSLALAASVCARVAALRDKRKVTGVGIAIAVLASILCLFATSLYVVVIARVIFGIGLGIVAAPTNALPADHHKPERIYAFMMIALAVIFAALVYVTPGFTSRFGAAGLFGEELALIIGLSLLLPLLPRGRFVERSVKNKVPALPRGSHSVLAAVTLMFIAQSGSWAFADQAGSALGIIEHSLANLFTISAIMMLAGAAGAAILGMKLGFRKPIVIGFGLQMFVAIAIYCMTDKAMFSVGVIVLSAAATFTLPYMQGVLAEIDESGRAVALSGAGVNFGAAIGPFVGGVLSFVPGLAPLGLTLTVALLLGLVLTIRVATGVQLAKPLTV